MKQHNAKHIKSCEKHHDAAVHDALQWLQVNNAPWTTVLDRWRASYPLRVGYLAKPKAEQGLIKLNLLRLITSEFGYQLVRVCHDFIVNYNVMYFVLFNRSTLITNYCIRATTLLIQSGHTFLQ